jgi:hypothetical protein
VKTPSLKHLQPSEALVLSTSTPIKEINQHNG